MSSLYADIGGPGSVAAAKLAIADFAKSTKGYAVQATLGQVVNNRAPTANAQSVTTNEDNAASGTLTVEGSIQGLNLKEFFLLLSSTGLAYRRCELVRVNGTEMDIRFLRGKHAKKKSGGSSKKEEAMH